MSTVKTSESLKIIPVLSLFFPRNWSLSSSLVLSSNFNLKSLTYSKATPHKTFYVAAMPPTPESSLVFPLLILSYLCHFLLAFQSLVESSLVLVLSLCLSKIYLRTSSLYSYYRISQTSGWSLLIYFVFWLIFNYDSEKHKNVISNTYNLILGQIVSYFPSPNWKRQKISLCPVFTMLVYVSLVWGWRLPREVSFTVWASYTYDCLLPYEVWYKTWKESIYTLFIV